MLKQPSGSCRRTSTGSVRQPAHRHEIAADLGPAIRQLEDDRPRQVLREDVLALLELELVRFGGGEVGLEALDLVTDRPALRGALPALQLGADHRESDDDRQQRDQEQQQPRPDAKAAKTPMAISPKPKPPAAAAEGPCGTSRARRPGYAPIPHLSWAVAMLPRADRSFIAPGASTSNRLVSSTISWGAAALFGSTR